MSHLNGISIWRAVWPWVSDTELALEVRRLDLGDGGRGTLIPGIGVLLEHNVDFGDPGARHKTGDLVLMITLGRTHVSMSGHRFLIGPHQ